jgi:hypothetical protein
MPPGVLGIGGYRGGLPVRSAPGGRFIAAAISVDSLVMVAPGPSGLSGVSVQRATFWG